MEFWDVFDLRGVGDRLHRVEPKALGLDSVGKTGRLATVYSQIHKAFVLGAGLGTRLRPLTLQLPKPLVPVWNRPLITYAFDHIASELGVQDFMVNTHHCPEAYEDEFPEGKYGDHQISFRHEPVLLDTGGGIDNIRDWLGTEEPFLVYNGDILTNLPLQKAWEAHQKSGNAVTLVLRSKGDELRVGFDPDTGKVVDMRGQIQPDWPHRYQFTGIYIVSPEFLEFIQSGKIESVVLPMLEAIRTKNNVGGVVIDEGDWSDLGERESYLQASALLTNGGFPHLDEGKGRISELAEVHPDARIDDISSVGDFCKIGAGAVIEESVIWKNVNIADGVHISRCILRDEAEVSENLSNQDL